MNEKRVMRIARGSGTHENEVISLLKNHVEMAVDLFFYKILLIIILIIY